MTNDNRRSTAGRLLTAVLAAMPLALWAQTPATITQESDWRRANDIVGALKRGHADVLRWEQAHPVAQDSAPSTAPTRAARCGRCHSPGLAGPPGFGGATGTSGGRRNAGHC